MPYLEFRILEICSFHFFLQPGAVVVRWLSSWLAEQEVRGSISALSTTISEIGYLLLLSRSRYGWKIAKVIILQTPNQPIFLRHALTYWAEILQMTLF